MRVLLFHLEAGGRIGPHEQASCEEFICVIDGRMRLYYGKEEYELGTGDAAHFVTHVDHHIENISDTDTRCLAIRLPQEYESPTNRGEGKTDSSPAG